MIPGQNEYFPMTQSAYVAP